MLWTWSASDEGIIALIEGQQVVFRMRSGQLVNTEQGITSYLEKAPAMPKTAGLLSLIIGKTYVGKCVSTAVDQGDGVLITEIDGTPFDGLITLQINSDGSVLANTKGIEAQGIWKETDGGIRVTMDNEPVKLKLINGQLAKTDDGITLYFCRDVQQSGPDGPPKGIARRAVGGCAL